MGKLKTSYCAEPRFVLNVALTSEFAIYLSIYFSPIFDDVT